ncbi:MAG: cyclodeaminase/cyclohydrolase family protein [Ignavibacterium sp.]
MNLQKTINEYIQELSSESPTPGGGNVSAFCGVLAASLSEMVCNLTIGKKKYADVENEIKNVKEELIKTKTKFLELAEKDNDAFNKVMDSFKLPKNNHEEIAVRNIALEKATLEAAEVPFDVIKLVKETLPLITFVAEKGNKNSISDAGVAASLLSTATEGAYLNVLINCSSLSNQTLANEFLIKAEIIYNEVKEKSYLLINEIKKQIKVK